MNYYSDELLSLGFSKGALYQKKKKKKKSTNYIDGELYIMTEVYIHVKYIHFQKNNEAILYNLFYYMKKRNNSTCQKGYTLPKCPAGHPILHRGLKLNSKNSVG